MLYIHITIKRNEWGLGCSSALLEYARPKFDPSSLPLKKLKRKWKQCIHLWDTEFSNLLPDSQPQEWQQSYKPTHQFPPTSFTRNFSLGRQWVTEFPSNWLGKYSAATLLLRVIQILTIWHDYFLCVIKYQFMRFSMATYIALHSMSAE